MNTTTKQPGEHMKNYIIDCIDGVEYDRDLKTTQEKLQFLYDTFKTEYGFNIKRLGLAGAIKEWYMGLPSIANIEFMNYKIVELLISWGELPKNPSDTQQYNAVEKYWRELATNTIELFKQYKITI